MKTRVHYTASLLLAAACLGAAGCSTIIEDRSDCPSYLNVEVSSRYDLYEGPGNAWCSVYGNRNALVAISEVVDVNSRDTTLTYVIDPRQPVSVIVSSAPVRSSCIVADYGDGQQGVRMATYSPELLPGVFTVSASGKTVRFAKGNLFWNGEEFRCEANQYDYPESWNASHVGHLFWSKDAKVAYAADYAAANTEFGITPDETDTFFAADGGVFEGFTVLSKDEWQYLINHSLEKGPSTGSTTAKLVTVNGKICAILKPDEFGETVADSYTAETWPTAEAAGLVALPFAGYRRGSSFNSVGTHGCYWPTVPSGSGSAWFALFNQGVTYMNGSNRNEGHSVRLVKVVNEGN